MEKTLNNGNWINLNAIPSAYSWDWYSLLNAISDKSEANLYFDTGTESAGLIYSFCYAAYRTGWLNGNF
jgi:hypothetical protein